MLVSPRKNGLTSLFKEVRVFKDKEVRPFFLGDNSIWSFPSVSSLSDYSIRRSCRLFYPCDQSIRGIRTHCLQVLLSLKENGEEESRLLNLRRLGSSRNTKKTSALSSLPHERECSQVPSVSWSVMRPKSEKLSRGLFYAKRTKHYKNRGHRVLQGAPPGGNNFTSLFHGIQTLYSKRQRPRGQKNVKNWLFRDILTRFNSFLTFLPRGWKAVGTHVETCFELFHFQAELPHLLLTTRKRSDSQKNPRAHKNKIGTPPPKKTQNTPPLKGGILWTWGFACRKNAFFQAPVKLAHPFPAPATLSCGQKFYGHEDFLIFHFQAELPHLLLTTRKRSDSFCNCDLLGHGEAKGRTLVAQCSATPATVAAKPPCRATPF